MIQDCLECGRHHMTDDTSDYPEYRFPSSLEPGELHCTNCGRTFSGARRVERIMARLVEGSYPHNELDAITGLLDGSEACEACLILRETLETLRAARLRASGFAYSLRDPLYYADVN